MTSPLKLSVQVTGDTKGLSSAMQEGKSGVQDLRQEVQQSAGAMSAQRAESERAAVAHRTAMEAARGRSQAEQELRRAVSYLGGIRILGDDAAFSEKRRNDVETYARRLDDLKAKYNPLYAVQRQYIAQLTEIKAAAAAGAITETERANAIAATKTAFAGQVTAMNGFVQAGHGAAKSTALASHEVTNLSYQVTDLAVQLASGQSPFMAMVQQGGQIVPILGQRGLGQIIPAIGSAIASLISPTTLWLAGITAAGYAGYYAFRSIVPEARSLDTILQSHADTIGKLRERYGSATAAARQYGQESNRALEYQMGLNERDLKKKQVSEANKLLEQTLGAGKLNTIASLEFAGLDPKKWVSGAARMGPIFDALMVLRQQVKDGTVDIGFLTDKLAEIGQDPKATPYMKELAEKITNAAKEAVNLGKELSKIDDLRVRRALFNVQPAWDIQRMNREQAAALQAMNARSPQEQAAAARAREALTVDEKEAPQVRALRIEQAGTLALAQAQKQLDDAQKQRNRSLSETLALAQLDLQLVGRSAAETEALRMEHQLLSEVRRQAAENNVAVDEAELARIRQMTAQYRQLRVMQSAQELLVSQQERMAQMKVEAALLGQTEAVRARVMAQLEAEREIRQRGIDIGSSAAAQIREQAAAMADLNATIERQSDAWRSVQQTAENSIDTVVDKLSSGDLSGALEAMAKDWTKTILQLSVSNPLKNGLLGTNYGTAEDLGGIQGIVGRLFGAKPDVSGVVQSALGGQNVGAMNVNAGTVVVNGGVATAALNGVAANSNQALAYASPSSAGAAMQTSATGVPAQMWNFFAQKGLKPHHIAAIVGHAGAESAFNPNAVGDNGQSFGLFQHHKDRAAALKRFTGGDMSVNKQLEFAWHELQTTENRAFRNLQSAPDLRSATAAFGGFERPQGFSWQNPEGMHNWNGRMKGAEDALRQFGTTATSATQNLDVFGGGLGELGKGLGAALSGAGAGGGQGGGFISALLSIGTSLFKGFSEGGYTGDVGRGTVAGVVHGGEVVINAGVVAKPGMRQFLEAINEGKAGYAQGGYVPLPRSAGGGGSSGFGGGGGQNEKLQLTVNNYSNANVRTEEESDGRGGRRSTLIIEDMTAQSLSRPGSSAARTMRQNYGVQQRLIKR